MNTRSRLAQNTLQPILVLIELAVLLSVANAAFAVDTYTPGFGLGGSDDHLSLSGGETRSVNISIEKTRSYECLVQPEFTSSAPSIVLYDPTNNPADITTNAIAQRGDVAPILRTSNALRSVRLSFSPATSGVYSLRITNDLFVVNAIKVRCSETTLYGGFNTNANPFNFLELTNLTSASISGRIIAYNFDGSEALNTGFTLQSNRRFDTDIHSAAGANKYGAIVVTHDGPLGAIEGNVSQYRGPVSGLSLSASVPLSIREQTF